jgi:hypothetical protein
MGSPYRNSKATRDKCPRGHAGIQSVEVGFTLLDAERDGAVERPLRALARQLSSELGARDA